MADESPAAEETPIIEGLSNELAHLTWLIGRWVGVGTGHYPTIEDFRFGQEVSFSTDGRPFLTYWSRRVAGRSGNRVRPGTRSGFLASASGQWRKVSSTTPPDSLSRGSGPLR